MTQLVHRYLDAVPTDRYSLIAGGGVLLVCGLALSIGLVGALIIAIVMLVGLQVGRTLAER